MSILSQQVLKGRERTIVVLQDTRREEYRDQQSIRCWRKGTVT